MITSNKSPILAFLTSKENLSAVLEIVRWVPDVRREVADRFWSRLQCSLKESKPAALDLNFSWATNIGSKPDDEFGLSARLQPVSSEVQGLCYSIAAGSGYFGLGLAWLIPAKNFESLCQIKAVRLLQGELNAKRPNSPEPDWPSNLWLWWEGWEENTYSDDPWSWFAKDEFDDAWCKDKAEKFWDFVAQIQQLVVEANKALKGLRAP